MHHVSFDRQSFLIDFAIDIFFFFSSTNFCCFITDSVIGIRSNYNVNEQVRISDINAANLSALAPPSTSNVTISDVGMHSNVNQNQLLFDKNPEKSPKKILESVNVHGIDTKASSEKNRTSTVPTPTITVTTTDDTMLDQISQDLDYLLNSTNRYGIHYNNRMGNIPPAPPPPISTAPTNRTVHEVILEEDAEDL